MTWGWRKKKPQFRFWGGGGRSGLFFLQEEKGKYCRHVGRLLHLLKKKADGIYLWLLSARVYLWCLLVVRHDAKHPADEWSYCIRRVEENAMHRHKRQQAPWDIAP